MVSCWAHTNSLEIDALGAHLAIKPAEMVLRLTQKVVELPGRLKDITEVDAQQIRQSTAVDANRLLQGVAEIIVAIFQPGAKAMLDAFNDGGSESRGGVGETVDRSRLHHCSSSFLRG